MKNPLDDIDPYELAEVHEAERILKELRSLCDIEKATNVHLTISYKGNVRRLLRAGLKVYRHKDAKDNHRFMLVHPSAETTNANYFTPVVLEKNQVVGM